eukprot:220515_1
MADRIARMVEADERIDAQKTHCKSQERLAADVAWQSNVRGVQRVQRMKEQERITTEKKLTKQIQTEDRRKKLRKLLEKEHTLHEKALNDKGLAILSEDQD